MTCPFSLRKAEADMAVIATVKENFRNHLLMALSEARAATVGIEPELREKLMDDLSKVFHPEGDASDLFVNGFYDAENMATAGIDELSDELFMQRRRAGYSVAAE
jgi:hypothetical protein